jgi:hypothetical protein
MAARQSTPASEHSHSDSNVRKRVCKACDRCRLKKSKCDGSSPCSRCRADNAICVFGERKKAHDKVYPKGYVEMLEQQQSWLVHGLQELYRRNLDGDGWPGEPLKLEPNGNPLTHDLLMRLGALDSSKGERFEESPESLQADLWSSRPSGMQRQESSDGGSETAQSPARSRFSDAFSHMPPTPPNYTTSPRAVKSEAVPSTPQFAPPNMGVVNPLALQDPAQWNGQFQAFEEMEMMPEYSQLAFDEMSPMFGRQMPMQGYLEKNDYEDFNQFLNPNPTEITSI